MLNAKELLEYSKIIPVISVESSDDMLHLADALIEGGLDIFEITLRTPAAIEALRETVKRFPQAIVGAGTVLDSESFKAIEQSGAKFAISPGLSDSLAKIVDESNIPLIPGVATASEIMIAREYGFKELKLFPATSVGGVDTLKSFGNVFPDVTFCPTGGINIDNAKSFLSLKNVSCIGGSWICNPTFVKYQKFYEITKLTKEALETL